MMSSSNLNGLSLFRQSEPVQDESDIEAELEVDQLDSDSDPEEQVSLAKPTKTKNGSGRTGEHAPGHTLLPAVRLENIVQAGGTPGIVSSRQYPYSEQSPSGVTGDLALSKEGLYVLSIATEEFIKRLIQAGYREANAHRRNQINYTDMAATTRQYQEFMCLLDTIPPPLTLSEALELRKRKERELIEDNPALAFPTADISAAPSPEPEHGTLSFPKPSKKARSTNGSGKEKANGSSSTGTKRSSKKTSRQAMEVDDGVLEWTMEDPANSRNGMSAAFSSIPPLSLNGHPSIISPSHSPPYSREDSLDPASIASQSRGEYSHSQTPPYDPTWQNQINGPASGFLQSSVATFNHVSQNPGRTIYSQTQRPD